MIKEMLDKVSQIHLWPNFLLEAKLHWTRCWYPWNCGVYKQCYERGKKTKIKLLIANILHGSCYHVAERWLKFEERGGQIIYSDNTYCCGRHFFCKLWEQSQSHYWNGIENALICFSSQQVQFHNTESLQVFRTHFHHLCVEEEEEVSLCWFCSQQISKGEGRTQQLSILAQPTVHITDLVRWHVEVYGIRHHTLQ